MSFDKHKIPIAHASICDACMQKVKKLLSWTGSFPPPYIQDSAQVERSEREKAS